MSSTYIKKEKKNSQKIELLNIHVKEYNLLGTIVQKVRYFLNYGGIIEKNELQKAYQEYVNYR